MSSQQNQAILDAGQATADQSQLHRDAAASQQAGQNPGIINQTGHSVKTMAHGAADIASGAADGVMGIAQGAAMGAANVAEGAAGAVKKTFGDRQPRSA